MTDKVESSSYGKSASPPRRPGAGARLKSFLKRWWWLLLIVFICSVLIVVLPLVFVGIPRIAQRDVRNSRLEIRSMVLTDPTRDSFHLRLEELLHSDSNYHPILDAFNASLFLEDTMPDIKPFALIEVPRIRSEDVTPITIDQSVGIADLDQFTRYTKLVMNSEEYRLAIRGSTGLHQKGLRKINVDYNEVVTLKGLNKLRGFNVTEFSILLQPGPDGANMVGKALIPNPSVMTLEMGNVTMNLFVEGDLIGTSLLPDLTLRPGDNIVDMRSTTNQSLVLQKLSKFTDGMVPIDIVGNSSILNGEHLTYYEEALKSNTVSIKLNVGRAVSGLFGNNGS
ncbi:MAG: hypothetical protein M1816_006102 [Peltula sp. TS41687]|nr:MAG: hypothetical protein M1816_006102 [Peltula sp. TS41687]